MPHSPCLNLAVLDGWGRFGSGWRKKEEALWWECREYEKAKTLTTVHVHFRWSGMSATRQHDNTTPAFHLVFLGLKWALEWVGSVPLASNCFLIRCIVILCSTSGYHSVARCAFLAATLHSSGRTEWLILTITGSATRNVVYLLRTVAFLPKSDPTLR